METFKDYGVNQPQMPKPDNYMVWAILTTICCCLPFGIVAIIKASQVNSLYLSGNYGAALMASKEAKKWTLIGVVAGLVVNVIWFVFYGFATVAAAL